MPEGKTLRVKIRCLECREEVGVFDETENIEDLPMFCDKCSSDLETDAGKKLFEKVNKVKIDDLRKSLFERVKFGSYFGVVSYERL